MQLGSAWQIVRENWRTVREKLPVSSAWRAVREKLPMPRGRLARSLASTAVIVVLSAAAGGKAAGPLVGARVDAASLPPAGSAAPAAKMAETPKAAPAAVVPVNYSPPAVSHVQLAELAPPTTATPSPASATGTDAALTPQAAAPPPAASGPDAAIAEQLHDLANGKFDGIIGGKKDRTTIDAFYSGRGYAPMWITDGKFNARAAAAIAYLGQVDADGLDPADYPVPDFASISDPAALAEAEIGSPRRSSPTPIMRRSGACIGPTSAATSSMRSSRRTRPTVLAAVLDAKDVAATLAGYEPQAPRISRSRPSSPNCAPARNDSRQGADPERAGAQDRRPGRPRAAIARAARRAAAMAARPTTRRWPRR